MACGNLSPQREKYAQLLAQGCTQSDAYRQAYPASKSWKPDSVHQKASKLAADPGVAARVDELRRQVVPKLAMTMESHMEELERLKGLALQAGKFEAAIKAEELRGKVKGLYVQRTEDVTDPMKKALGRMPPEKLDGVIQALEKVQAIREASKGAA